MVELFSDGNIVLSYAFCYDNDNDELTPRGLDGENTQPIDTLDIHSVK